MTKNRNALNLSAAAKNEQHPFQIQSERQLKTL